MLSGVTCPPGRCGQRRGDRPGRPGRTVLTIANTAHRAFLGGVHVLVDGDVRLDVPWGRRSTPLNGRRSASEARSSKRLDPDRPTLAGGQARPPLSASPSFTSRTPVGPAAWSSPQRASLKVRRASRQQGLPRERSACPRSSRLVLGDPVPGRRDCGVSLWRPDLHWRDHAAAGPDLQYLPANLWLLGLGHLGQAYAWVLGMLPYATPAEVCLGLVDYDRIVKGDTATQLLVSKDDVDRRKSRVVACCARRTRLRVPPSSSAPSTTVSTPT